MCIKRRRHPDQRDNVERINMKTYTIAETTLAILLISNYYSYNPILGFHDRKIRRSLRTRERLHLLRLPFSL